MTARFAMRTCDRCGRQVLVTKDGCCPHCDAALVASTAPQVVEVRLTSKSALPDCCMQCGEPTRRTVRVRARGPRPAPGHTPQGEFESSTDPGIGPFGLIGLLVSAVCLLWDELFDTFARRGPKLGIRTRQCRECARGGGPRGFAPDYDLQRLSFEAHPRFAASLDACTRDARRTRAARGAVPPRGDEKAKPLSPS